MTDRLRFKLEPAVFLKEHWQRQPLFIPNALPGFQSPLTPNELAGLALEEDIESRIVGFQNGIWTLAQGPFTDADFDRSDVWTLLVQQVDRWIPEVAALKQCVDFLPDWRFDDVMVSYAVDGGSVGPHFDRYDVFLLQGAGSRLWRVGQHCDESTPRLDHDKLHLLESFETTAEYLLGPGDVLYIPPGVAHWGVAQGECITYSLGFRAPPVASLIARMTDEVLEALPLEHLLADGINSAAGRPGEITREQIDHARRVVMNTITQLDTGRWLGELVTETGYEDGDPGSYTDTLGDDVMLNPGARIAWFHQGASIVVCANGDSIEVANQHQPLIEQLCAGERLARQLFDEPKETGTLWRFLIANRVVVTEEDG